MKLMKERNPGNQRKPEEKKQTSASSCVQQTAELLGLYSRILRDLRRAPSAR